MFEMPGYPKAAASTKPSGSGWHKRVALAYEKNKDFV